MKRLSGFSLMEMMIVLTIVAIVAAASAPMVNKKMVRAASEKSPWIFTNGESIAYNLDNPNGIQDNKTARIGSGSDAPNGVHPRLYITTNSDATPHIMFGRNNNTNLMRLTAGGERNNIWFSNSNNVNARDSVVIGPGAEGSNHAQVIIGNNATATTVRAVAIGNNTRVDREESTAIGSGATATGGAYGTALGFNASAGASRTTAIGSLASSTAEGAIAIGSTSPSETATSSAAANSIAIGRTARALRGNSIAIGYNACISPNNAGGANSIAIGNGANTNQDNTIIIGTAATSTALRAIALGMNARAGDNAIAIGSSTTTNPTIAATGAQSIAIGYQARATAANSIAIGRGAAATGSNSVAIGRGVSVAANNTIVLGSNDDIVRIPGSIQIRNLTITGDLVVEGNTLLGGNKGSKTYMREDGTNGCYRLTRFRDTYSKVDRQGNRGSITAFDMARDLDVTMNGKKYYNAGGSASDDDGGDDDFISPAAQAKIDELTNKIAALEARMAALEAKLK